MANENTVSVESLLICHPVLVCDTDSLSYSSEDRVELDKPVVINPRDPLTAYQIAYLYHLDCLLYECSKWSAADWLQDIAERIVDETQIGDRYWLCQDLDAGVSPLEAMYHDRHTLACQHADRNY